MEKALEELYRRLRLHYYSRLFSAIQENPGSLSATEAFSAEVIYLLDRPTIREFADFLGISQPNASYKVVSLVSKGYLIKEPCVQDKRGYQLVVTKKFLDYYGSQLPDLSFLLQGLSPEEESLLKKLCQKTIAALPSISGEGYASR